MRDANSRNNGIPRREKKKKVSKGAMPIEADIYMSDFALFVYDFIALSLYRFAQSIEGQE